MGDKFRVGVIGCGGMAANHVSGYLECDRFQISAISDLSSEAMIAFDKKFNGYKHYQPKHYLDAYEMLDSENLDVVSIANGTKVMLNGQLPLQLENQRQYCVKNPWQKILGTQQI